MKIHVLGTTFSAPAPPYITSQAISGDMVSRMQTALLDAFADPQLVSAKNTLLLDGIDITSEAEYLRSHQDFKHDFQKQIKSVCKLA